MPSYVYACPKSKRHPRKEVTHGMNDDPVIQCEACGAKMRRVPQPFRFYMSPVQVLYDWSDENYRRYRARKAGKRAPRFSPDHVNSPTPLAGKDFEHRRLKPNGTKKRTRTT